MEIQQEHKVKHEEESNKSKPLSTQVIHFKKEENDYQKCNETAGCNAHSISFTVSAEFKNEQDIKHTLLGNDYKRNIAATVTSNDYKPSCSKDPRSQSIKRYYFDNTKMKYTNHDHKQEKHDYKQRLYNERDGYNENYETIMENKYIPTMSGNDNKPNIEATVTGNDYKPRIYNDTTVPRNQSYGKYEQVSGGPMQYPRKTKQWCCEQCNKKYYTKETLAKHVESVHEAVKEFTCALCGKSFRKQRILDFHISTHKEFWMECGVCKRPFRRIKDLKLHMITHENKVPYFCLICKLGFTEKNEFKKHKKTHNNKMPSNTSQEGFYFGY